MSYVRIQPDVRFLWRSSSRGAWPPLRRPPCRRSPRARALRSASLRGWWRLPGDWQSHEHRGPRGRAGRHQRGHAGSPPAHRRGSPVRGPPRHARHGHGNPGRVRGRLRRSVRVRLGLERTLQSHRGHLAPRPGRRDHGPDAGRGLLRRRGGTPCFATVAQDDRLGAAWVAMAVIMAAAVAAAGDAARRAPNTVRHTHVARYSR